jgi:hypothetical protein
MRPVAGSKMTRVRPRRVPPVLVKLSLVAEAETVIKLMPSPFVPGGFTESMPVEVSTSRMFAASDQRRSALRAAPNTSLPGLMLAGGELSELESAMLICVVLQLT